jgi:hypothetical protein
MINSGTSGMPHAAFIIRIKYIIYPEDGDSTYF